MASFTLEKLAEITNGKLIKNKELAITNVNTLEDATPDDASFLANPRYIDAMKRSKAGVIFINDESLISEDKNFLITQDPSFAFQQVIKAFKAKTTAVSSYCNIHPTAFIHPSATIADNVTIGPFCAIDSESTIGEGSVLGSHVSISEGVHIGKACTIHAHVTIREHCVIQDRVILQPGAVIGSCGFGFTQDSQGRFIKLEQLGNVILEDDVEIGANTTIDRARFKSTIIRRGTKIDNLVQIAHNVEIGENNGIAAQTGIAGSSKTGNNILMGGQVGIIGHVEITDFVMLATRSGVSKSITKPGKYRGSPVIPLDEYNKQHVYIKRLAKTYEKIDALIKRVEEIEKKVSN